jgi:hypothetical protein
MELSNLKYLVFLLVIMAGVGSAMALSVGGSIHIDLNVSGSSANITANTSTNITANESNSIDDSITEEDGTNTDTQTDNDNTLESSSDSNNDYYDYSSDDTYSDNYEENISSNESIDEKLSPTGASVSKSSNILNPSKTGKILMMGSTIVLAIVFIGSLFVYKRRMNYGEEIIESKKISRKSKKRK